MMLQLPSPAVRDTISRVFQDDVYDRSIKTTLFSRLSDLVASMFRELLGAIRASPELSWALAVLAMLIIIAIVIRQIELARQRATAASPGRDARDRGRGMSRDPWILAQQLAAEGNFTDAAHALYRALLEALARRERLRLHPSKTAGDYVRELRKRSSGALVRFRDFARSYDTVIYGIGECDRERYERLHALAAPLIQAGG